MNDPNIYPRKPHITLRLLIFHCLVLAFLASTVSVAHASETLPPETENEINEESISDSEGEAETPAPETIADSIGEQEDTNQEGDSSNPEGDTETSAPETIVDSNGEQEVTNEEGDSSNPEDESPESSEVEQHGEANDAIPDEPEAVESVPEPIQASDPYFFVEGVKHSFLPSNGNCEGVENCETSTTPITDALSAVTGGLTPDDNTIYVVGGIVEEDVLISGFTDLTLHGAANDKPSILAGKVNINNSSNIALLYFTLQEVLGVSDSADISVVGTDADDEIELNLEGDIENLNIDGAEGDDSITLNLQAESSSVSVTDSGDDENDSLTINQDDDLQVSQGQVSSDKGNISFDDSIETLTLESQEGGIEVQGDTTVEGKIVLFGENINVEADLAAQEISLRSLVTTYISGSLYASNKEVDEIGGPIYILGQRVVLADDAFVTASGEAGGGTILIGGDYQGMGTIPNAARVFVGPEVVIEADAITQGSGGRVIVWSDEITGFAGSIVARGGFQRGDGGFVEVSGKNSLAFTGKVDVSAPSGQTGILLLDPVDITIQTSGVNDAQLNDNEILYGDDAGSSYTISANKISTNLATANVSLQANNDITLAAGANITKASGGDTTLTLEAKNNITIGAVISSTSNKLNVILLADSDNSGAGIININEDITSNDGDVTVQGASITTNTGDRITAGNGNVHYKPSTPGTTIGIGNSATGTFKLDGDDLATRLGSSGYVTVGRDDGTGAVDIQAIDQSLTNYTFVVRGGDVTFNGTLLKASPHVEIFSNGAIIDNNAGVDVNITNTGMTLILSSDKGVGTAGDPIETEVGIVIGEAKTSGGFFVTNTGALTLNTIDGVSGITTNGGGITVIATSPLTVNRAIRENAGGNINLTAGNNSSALGDNLTIDAEVVVSGGNGKITGNAGDEIEIKSSGRASAPGGVSFTAGLDGDADNGGGKASISGKIDIPNPSTAGITINAANGITLNNGSQIITWNGKLLLTATNGLVARNGLIDLHGGQLIIVEKPPDVLAGAVIPGGQSNGDTTGPLSNTNDGTLAALTAVSAVLSILSGQQVSLLEAVVFGDTVTLQLPEGDGATFITGINALVAMITGDEVVLPAELPSGFNLLSSLAIEVEHNDPNGNIGEMLVSFETPTNIDNQNLVILHWSEEEGWVEVPIEDTVNGKIEGLSEDGGIFVLVEGTAEVEAEVEPEAGVEAEVEVPVETVASGNQVVQTALSGQSGDITTISLPQGNQLIISGGAGDNVNASPLDLDSLPGNLPAGFTAISGLSVEITANGAGVNILPNGETMGVQFNLPDGSQPNDVAILMWVPTGNGGQGNWVEIPAQLTSNGRVAIDIFLGGNFVLAGR